MSRHRFPSNHGLPYKLQDGGMSNRRLRKPRSDVPDSGNCSPTGRWSHAQAACAVVQEEQPLIGSPGRPRTRENFAEFVAQQQKLRSRSQDRQQSTVQTPFKNPARQQGPRQSARKGKVGNEGVTSPRKPNGIPKLAEAALPDQSFSSTSTGHKNDQVVPPSSVTKAKRATRQPSSQKMKKGKLIKEPVSQQSSAAVETSLDVPPEVEANEYSDNHVDDVQELLTAELARSSDQFRTVEDVLESEPAFHVSDNLDDGYLDAIAEDADAQMEALKEEFANVGGKYTRGTKSDPWKGIEDPIDIGLMRMNQDAGGEELHFSMADTVHEQDAYYAQEDRAVSKAEPGPHLDIPKAKRRKSPKSPEGTSTIIADVNAPPSSKKSTTTRRTKQAVPYYASLEENNARYGMDASGKRTPTRFQWWQRATSRDSRAKELAKRAHVTRRAPLVRRLMAHDYWYKPLKLYTETFVPLIEAEHAHEEKVISERLRTMTAEKLVAEGYCLNELTATKDLAAQAGRPTYTFALGGKGARRFTWNRFNPGTSVIISTAGEKVDPITKEQGKRASANTTYNTGSVVSKTPGSLKVSFDERLTDETLAKFCRLDIWTSDIVVRRAKEALATLHHDPVAIDRYDHSKMEATKVPPDARTDTEIAPDLPKRRFAQTILPGTALRSVLLDGFIAEKSDIPSPAKLSSPGFFADNELIQSWCRRQLVEGRRPVEIEGDPLLTLNTSQRRAIATMLSSNMSLVQGPPGTGKTRTIIEMLHLLKVRWQVPQPILVSAYTNNACDNLAEGMSKRGLKVLRYGSRSRIREDLKELTLEWYLDQHRHKWVLARLKAEIYRTPKDDPNRETLRRQLFGLERRMMLDVLLDVDVVSATCISSRGRLLEVLDFPVVFLDEASMATEPNALIPLTKGCQHAALIGDHKQLPPLVISATAEAGNLQTSLFERLIKTGKIPSVMLDTQYRMHPAISAFPNKAFYESKLKDGTLDDTGAVKAGLEPPQSDLTRNDATGLCRTVTFLHHTGQEIARAKSIVNEGEAKIVYDVVVDLLLRNPELKGDDIGVIAPYAGQISCIVNELRHDPKRQEQSWGTLGEKRSQEVNEVEVHTVDGFEGREKKVIVFSTTRSNDANSIGFLADWRRMNVGLTRAKAGLVIVGNRYTLENTRRNTIIESLEKTGAAHWRNLIRDLDAANAIADLEPELNQEGYSDEELDRQNRALEDDFNFDDMVEEAARMTA